MNTNYNVTKLFEAMEKDLIKNLEVHLSNHLREENIEGFNWTQWQSIKLKEFKDFSKRNKDILTNYQPFISRKAEQILRKEFKQGAGNFLLQLRNKGNKDIDAKFFSINERKVKALIKSAQKDYLKAEHALLRKTDDIYRQVVWSAANYSSFGITTTTGAVNKAIEELTNNGNIKCIKYSNGAVHSIDSYISMAVRTTEKRAYLAGEGSKRDEYGMYLVKMSTHLHCCDACADWEGGIYIDNVYANPSDEEINRLLDKGYTLLSDAIDGGAFHPNCRHGLSVFIELD